ncbi:MAG: hypothetical protein J7L45_03550 [Candidatus Aenigmarchaeota archaeon]|nr:hypothetical protein [Candidatus Aenigmarchaeota archaeon]
MVKKIEHENFTEFIGKFAKYEVILSRYTDENKTDVDILREIKLIAPNDNVVKKFIEEEAKDLGGTWKWITDHVYEQDKNKYFIYERVSCELSNTLLI